MITCTGLVSLTKMLALPVFKYCFLHLFFYLKNVKLFFISLDLCLTIFCLTYVRSVVFIFTCKCDSNHKKKLYCPCSNIYKRILLVSFLSVQDTPYIIIMNSSISYVLEQFILDKGKWLIYVFKIHLRHVTTWYPYKIIMDWSMFSFRTIHCW